MASMESEYDPSQKRGKSLLQKYDILIEHLDYAYIEKCKNIKELEKIVKILRSGEEGIYPQLTEFAESHLKKLCPQSSALRKQQPAATRESLGTEEWHELCNDINSWTEKMQEVEKQLKSESHKPEYEQEDTHPVRGRGTVKGKESQSSEAPGNGTGEKQDHGKTEVEDLESVVDLEAGCTEAEKRILAAREKNKGNEYFKVGELEKALRHYTRSISIFPTPAAHNNRALMNLKLEKFGAALLDCNQVLKVEPQNVKALLRRGLVHKVQKDYFKASLDFQKVVDLEPNNCQAHAELKTLEKLLKDMSKPVGKRISIEEIDGESECEVDDYSVPLDGRVNTEEEKSATDTKPEQTTSPLPEQKGEDMAGNKEETSNLDPSAEEPVRVPSPPELYRLDRQSRGLNDLLGRPRTKIDVANKYKKSTWTSKESRNETDKDRDGARSAKVIRRTEFCSEVVWSEDEQSEVSGKEVSSPQRGSKMVESNGLTKEPVRYDAEICDINNTGGIEVKDQGKTVEVKEVGKDSDEDMELMDSAEKVNDSEQNSKAVIISENSKLVSESCENLETTKIREMNTNEHQTETTVSPYEFVKAWQALKGTSDFKGHAILLKQLEPSQLPAVIGNKLDGSMLGTILHCLKDHFTEADKLHHAFLFLQNLTRLPRFAIVLMFLSSAERKVAEDVLVKLEEEGHDISGLRRSYSV